MEPGYYSCDGFGDASRTTSRRQLIAIGLGAGAALFGTRSAFAQATFRNGPKDGPVLVVLFLRGGADGLNIIAPYGEDAYYRSRPTLSLKGPKDASAKVSERLNDQDGFFGLHPSLSDLGPLFGEGRLALVHAVGSGDETRSHFEAMGTMERGLYEGSYATSNGWVARHVAQTPERSAPLRTLALSPTLPDSLSGVPEPVVCQSLDEYRLHTADGSQERVHQTLSKLYRGGDEIEDSGRRTLEALMALRKKNPADYQPANGAVYSADPLAQALKEVAYLVKAGIGLEIACLESLGWDTHVAQGSATGWQANLLKNLGQSLAAFDRDLGTAANQVCVVVQTEFGRRLEENSGFGTDHGHGGMMMVLCGGVKGGKVYGAWPGLSKDKLVGPGDLAVTTDYRTVLSEILREHLGCPDVGQVFPGWEPTSLNLFNSVPPLKA